MGEQWWLNPVRWVDEDDLFDLSGSLTVNRAIDVLKDKHVHRPTDESVMVRGVRQSVKCGLTRRQESALELAREAVQAGATATVYVAQQLGINRFSAYKLLKRADMKFETSPKMETSGTIFPVYHKQRGPAERDIKKLMNSLRIDCAGCGKSRGATGRYALCRECFETYGADGERRDETSRWLDPMIRRAWRDARKQAIEILMMSDANPMALVG